MFNLDYMSIIWSAAPTPLLQDGTLDEASIRRLAEHHYRLGVRGVFIGGTSGEGPYLPQKMRHRLAAATVKAHEGRMATAIQITDNSAERMIDNLRYYADTGIDMAVIAPPFVSIHASQDYLFDMYARVIEASPVPIGLYHHGTKSTVPVLKETIVRLARLEKVLTLKDSAGTPEDTAAILGVRDALRGKKHFFAYSGNEFDCIGAAQAGYDGMMIGGACFNAAIARKIFLAARSGNLDEARNLQERLNRLMYDVFGGPKIECWLAGEKQLMVELGVFTSNYCVINYRLNPECYSALKAALLREKEYLDC